MLDLVFMDAQADPGVRAADALAERLVSGLSMASRVRWECDCGPIDEEYAVTVRIKLEVLSKEMSDEKQI